MGAFIGVVLGLCGVVSLSYPDRPAVERTFEGGLDRELGGQGAVLVSWVFFFHRWVGKIRKMEQCANESCRRQVMRRGEGMKTEQGNRAWHEWGAGSYPLYICH